MTTHRETANESQPASHGSLHATSGTVGEVFRVFLRLGVTAFGGPAAHIAAMEDEIVRRRQWVTDQEFLDMMSAANLMPGPNSTELAIHLGYRRAGLKGLVAAGLAFIVPATLMVWVLAIAYVEYGTRPEVTVMLTGMQPVVLAVVAHALWRLRTNLLQSPLRIAIAVVATVGVLAGAHELLVLALAAIVGLALVKRETGSHQSAPVFIALPVSVGKSFSAAASAIATAVIVPVQTFIAPTIMSVFLSFLKIGSVLFGSGYVLLAFMRAEFVVRQGWVSETQLLDAIAVGQLTPGPVFTSATFVGYLMAGHLGAVAATVGIFLPAFLFVAFSGLLIRRIRRSPRLASALDAVNAASLALMAAVLITLLKPVASTPALLVIFLIATVLLIRTQIGAAWILFGGALLGGARAALSTL